MISFSFVFEVDVSFKMSPQWATELRYRGEEENLDPKFAFTKTSR
jgi:hypothetical protein